MKQVLKSVTVITKCNRKLLQTVIGITKCDKYYKVSRNKGVFGWSFSLFDGKDYRYLFGIGLFSRKM